MTPQTQPSRKNWSDIEPAEAAKLSRDELERVDRPTNENGETCPWPWEPQQLAGAPLGQFHCSYCGGMQVAGLPHLDHRGEPEGAVETVTFVADWAEALTGQCDCCGEDRDVLTFNADADHIVDLCRSCALELAQQTDELADDHG